MSRGRTASIEQTAKPIDDYFEEVVKDKLDREYIAQTYAKALGALHFVNKSTNSKQIEDTKGLWDESIELFNT